jgi:tetratricopeptide (TPR) repeat protein
MFVMGAVKAREADAEASEERRSATFHIAARYLRQAYAHGLPPGREAEGARLLGVSLVNGGEADAAVPYLEEALERGAEPANALHAYAVRALLESAHPNLEAALAHNELVIRDPALAGTARDEAWLLRGETLLRLGRDAEARQALEQVAVDGRFNGRRAMLLGRLDMAAAEALPAGSDERAAKLDAAVLQFEAAQKADIENGDLTRQGMYWTAHCFELRGSRDAALAQYRSLRNLFGDTDEGVAAEFAEADAARTEGDTPRALAGYRAVLQAIGNPHTYDNHFLPLAEVRQRLRAAYEQFLANQQFGDALTMLDLIEPVVGRADCTELRAKTEQAWGAYGRGQAETKNRQEADDAARASRAHLRAAGRAYEDLAKIRYATRYYPGDLWAAADCYFQGQSFSNAARLFQDYLHNESRQWNDMALVRLGQSQLALGEYDRAIATLEECIELFPDNPVTHQARLEAARAYGQLSKYDEAERLLAANLEALALTPDSPEWQDSLYEMGYLLYERQRYGEAVSALQNAVDRWPDHPASLLAKYTVARAYHSGASALNDQLREPTTTDNEAAINRSRRQITEYLENAHATYLEVQKTITLAGGVDEDPFLRTLLRNCYMMQGSVLMELRRFDEARQAYQSVITRFQNDPVVLESFVQVANCFRRLEQPQMARGNLERAKVVLGKLPPDADFLASTNFNRQQWTLLLDEMIKW